jgi:hypothetical protein
MTRPVVGKEALYARLGGLASRLGPSRIDLMDSVLLVNCAGIGTPGYEKETGTGVAAAAWDLGIPAYVMYSPVRSDSGVYKRISVLLASVLHTRGVTCYARPYGLHVSIPVGTPPDQMESLASMLAEVCTEVTGGGNPLRYILTSPDGYAMREFGVTTDTTLCGRLDTPPPAGTPPAVSSVVPPPPVITRDDVSDFCIMLHTSGQGVDALDLITRLDAVGGGRRETK